MYIFVETNLNKKDVLTIPSEQRGNVLLISLIKGIENKLTFINGIKEQSVPMVLILRLTSWVRDTIVSNVSGPCVC